MPSRASGVVAVLRVGLALNLHRDRAVAGRRQAVRQRRRLDARKRLQPRQQLLEEADARGRVGIAARGRSTRAVRTFSIANGICTFFSWTTLLIIRPAAISSPHDTASSATTRPLLNRPRPALVDDRLSSLSAAPAIDPRRVHRRQRAGRTGWPARSGRPRTASPGSPARR